MTKAQIKKALTDAGVIMRHVTIESNKQIKIYNPASRAVTEHESRKAARALGWGGFRCGYGAWILQSCYRPDPLVSANVD